MIRFIALAVLVATASAARNAPATSPLWGKSGEKWKPEGPFMDFSYAGYRNSDASIPRPPVTKRLEDFQGKGRSDSSALKAMVDWANKQPDRDGWIVLSLPAGTLELREPLEITRSQTVLRGAGKGRTKLSISNSLMDEWGRSKYGGYYSSRGAWLTAAGLFKNEADLAQVTPSAERGSFEIEVDRTSRLQEGDMVTVMYSGNRYELAEAIMDNELKPGEVFDTQEVYLFTEIKKIEGKTVTLKRALPLDIKRPYDVSLVQRYSSLHSVGIEGLTVEFEWGRYSGHHRERGFNAIELEKVRDGWVRDVGVVNADNGVLVTSCTAVTVEGLDVTVTKDRDGPRDAGGESWDGHWGVRVGLSTDVLVRDFSIEARMHHSVGTDSRALFCVFEGGRCPGGNMELHRSQTAQILFTDIDVEGSDRGFYSGGPGGGGPASGAWTTFWNIRSKRGEHALPEHNGGSGGSCNFGAKLNFIGVTFKRASKLCDDWVYQPGTITPPNLFAAQLKRRKGGTKPPPPSEGEEGGDTEQQEAEKEKGKESEKEGGREPTPKQPAPPPKDEEPEPKQPPAEQPPDGEEPAPKQPAPPEEDAAPETPPAEEPPAGKEPAQPGEKPTPPADAPAGEEAPAILAAASATAELVPDVAAAAVATNEKKEQDGVTDVPTPVANKTAAAKTAKKQGKPAGATPAPAANATVAVAAKAPATATERIRAATVAGAAAPHAQATVNVTAAAANIKAAAAKAAAAVAASTAVAAAVPAPKVTATANTTAPAANVTAAPAAKAAAPKAAATVKAPKAAAAKAAAKAKARKAPGKKAALPRRLQGPRLEASVAAAAPAPATDPAPYAVDPASYTVPDSLA